MKSLSEDASDVRQAAKYLNRSAGRLEDRHQIPGPAHAPAEKEAEVVNVDVDDEPSTQASRARVSRATLERCDPAADARRSPASAWLGHADALGGRQDHFAFLKHCRRESGGAHHKNRRTTMTANIGNKHVAQHRGAKERAEIRKTNIAREAVKQAEARAKYRNQQKGKPLQALAA
jgi:hypothetical protein